MFILLPLLAKLPPSSGDVSATKSVFTVSNVGSAPLLALKNLPSLLDVPCSNFAKDIESSANLEPAIAALPSIFELSIDPLAIFTPNTAPSAILAVSTAPLVS